MSLFRNAVPAFSEQEKESLEYIFDHLFRLGNFTYTLFSDKPISFEDIYTSNTSHITMNDYSILLSYQRPINILDTSWKV